MVSKYSVTMRVGYTVYEKADQTDEGAPLANISSVIPPSPAEGASLFVVAILGGLGNLFVMIVTLTCPKFRQMSSAFLFHHCLLDAIKSVFCLPFGFSLLLKNPIPHCDVLGAAYILLMTVSAYNLLALLINEEYQCSLSARTDHRKNGDSCCIAFGVVIIWFTTVLLHLGVAFLPGSSEYNRDIGNCIYRYGVTKNYVIHALWVLLVTGAVTVAAVSFFHFYRKLRSGAQSHKWTFLHKSLSSLTPRNNPVLDSQAEEVLYEFDDLSSQSAILLARRYLRRIMVMMMMVVSFVLCWYPLFLLTLFDVHYQQPAHIYRMLMILAWTHPLTTPIFCGIIYYDMASGVGVTRDVYSNAIPMTSSRSGEAIRQDVNHLHSSAGNLVFRNENFQFYGNHVGSPEDQFQSTEHQPSHCDPLDNFSHRSLQCETITNYSVEEGACQTLIM